MIYLFITLLLTSLVGLGYWIKNLIAKVARLEAAIQAMEIAIDRQKKQLNIAAAPNADRDTVLDLMRKGAL